jgi:RNA processing factor Prp31
MVPTYNTLQREPDKLTILRKATDLIVEANNLTVEIDVEINIIHKYIRDKYTKRLPELESLVQPAMDYMRTVRILGELSLGGVDWSAIDSSFESVLEGNRVEKAKNNEEIQQFLRTASILIVSVSASTTQGTDLSDADMAMVNEACTTASIRADRANWAPGCAPKLNRPARNAVVSGPGKLRNASVLRKCTSQRIE